MFWCKLRIEPRSNFAGRLNILCQEVHFVKKGTGCILWTISIGYGTTDDTMYYMQAAVICCCLFDAVDRFVPCVTGQ